MHIVFVPWRCMTSFKKLREIRWMKPFGKWRQNPVLSSASPIHKVIRKLCCHIYCQIVRNCPCNIFRVRKKKKKRQIGKLYFHVVSPNSVDVLFFQRADYFIWRADNYKCNHCHHKCFQNEMPIFLVVFFLWYQRRVAGRSSWWWVEELVLSGTLGISWSRKTHSEVTECSRRPLSLTLECDVLLGNVGKALEKLF